MNNKSNYRSNFLSYRRVLTKNIKQSLCWIRRKENQAQIWSSTKDN